MTRISRRLTLLLAVSLLEACSTRPPVGANLPIQGTKCRLSAFLRGLAGPDALNCGSVPEGADRSTIDAWSVAAFRSNRPFHATYETSDREIEDIVVANGFIRTADSELFFFTYEFAPYHSEDPPQLFTFRVCSGARVVSSPKGYETIACW